MKNAILFYFVLLLGWSHAQSSADKDSLKAAQKAGKAFMKNNGFVYIPAGSYYVGGRYDQDVPDSPAAKVVSIPSFYMMEGEVSNADYLNFLYWIKQRDTVEWRKNLPDTLVWRDKMAYMEPYVIYYLRHPAYADYPVVGVSYDQAVAYCKWSNEAYNANPEREFDQVLFCLPTEEQWEYAARGDLMYSDFPWGGPNVRNAEGEYMANCLHFDSGNVWHDTLNVKNAEGDCEPLAIYRAGPGSEYEGSASRLNDASDITAPVISYWPNGYGLYNMAGNVAEMVAEPGMTRGGSWRDPGAYLRNSVRQYYSGTDSSSAKRGFRIAMVVVAVEKK